MKLFVVACVSLASSVHADVIGTDSPSFKAGGVFVTSDMPAGCADSACMVGHGMEVDPTALAECIAASVWGCKITHTPANPSFSVGPIYKAETTVYGTATGFLVTAPPTLEACVSDVCRDQLVTEADLERCRLATPKDCTYAVPTNYYYPNCATADKKEFQMKMPAAEHGNSLAQTFLTAKINIIGGTCTAVASETVSSVFNPANGECSAPLEGDAVALATFATNHVTVNFENVTEVLINPVYAAKLTCSAAPTGLEPDRAGLAVISHFVGASAGVLSNVSVGFVSIIVALLYASQY